MVLVRLPNRQQPDSMNYYNLKAAPTALSKEQKSQNSPKAKRIVMGVGALSPFVDWARSFLLR
jgi:hypothetical protein